LRIKEEKKTDQREEKGKIEVSSSTWPSRLIGSLILTSSTLFKSERKNEPSAGRFLARKPNFEA
jgi:hypothetical protein